MTVNLKKGWHAAKGHRLESNPLPLQQGLIFVHGSHVLPSELPSLRNLGSSLILAKQNSSDPPLSFHSALTSSSRAHKMPGDAANPPACHTICSKLITVPLKHPGEHFLSPSHTCTVAGWCVCGALVCWAGKVNQLWTGVHWISLELDILNAPQTQLNIPHVRWYASPPRMIMPLSKTVR